MPDNLQGFLFLAGVVILIFTVLRVGRRRRATTASGEPASRWHRRAKREDPHHIGEKQELGEVIVELQEVAREIDARLDTRIRYARRLLEESEEVLARLEQTIHAGREVLEGKPEHRPPGPNPPTKEPSSGPAPRRPVDADQREILQMAESGMSPTEIALKMTRPVGEVELILNLRRQADSRRSP
ncbi:MAG: hypothetical protein V3T77_07930 [Planctomycetota bacterium]